MGQIFGCIGMIVFLSFGLYQLFASFVGAEQYVGGLFAFLIIAGSAAAKFMLPVIIFVFLGAKNVWGWPWYWAALFAAPGLVLVVPSYLAQIIDGMSRSIRRH